MFTILIVDDTPENLTLMSGLLEPLYQVRAAGSGARALAVAASDPRPDLILLDIMMPGMDGYEVMRQLKANPVTADIPVIFVTALDSGQDEEQGLQLGAVDFIAKPVRPAIMLARVKNHLDLKSARDELQARNKLLEAEVAARMEENAQIHDISIRSLAHLAEIRSRESSSHLKRTQLYMRALALHLRNQERFASYLSEKNVKLLVQSAPLHDIGKVGVPDHVLCKPGKLNGEEWELVKQHSSLGYQAIRDAEQDQGGPVDFLSMAKDIAYYHHERWDGSGYPKGLAEEDIPISARLMAVADVFDALISRRSYKPAYSFDAAVEMMREGRGTHFDPDVLDAFLAHLGTFESIASRYADGGGTSLQDAEQSLTEASKEQRNLSGVEG